MRGVQGLREWVDARDSRTWQGVGTMACGAQYGLATRHRVGEDPTGIGPAFASYCDGVGMLLIVQQQNVALPFFLRVGINDPPSEWLGSVAAGGRMAGFATHLVTDR